MPGEKLPKEEFLKIINYTPLISIDLVVYNESDEVLLGRRINAPALNYYFVPGGRIRKNEKMKDAFERITKAELGKKFKISEAKFLGIYEHLYENENFANEPLVDTHYVVLGYKINVKEKDLHLPDDQHSDYLWLKEKSILNFKKAHKYTKNYFKKATAVS